MGTSGWSLELEVLALIESASKSREEWEARYPHLSPLDDAHMTLMNWAATVERQGLILAGLAMYSRTRAELMTDMTGIVDRAPAWLDAHLQGRQTMTLRLFLEGIAQTMTTQRAALERVVAEQVVNPGSIEEVLAEAPVPAGSPDEPRDAMLHGVGNAITAHMKALVDLAYDLEQQVVWGPDGDE